MNLQQEHIKGYAVSSSQIESRLTGKPTSAFNFPSVKKCKSLTKQQRQWFNRRQAVEPAIGHLKLDHRMDGFWLQGGKPGDALHVVLCATVYNLHWL